LRSQEEKDEHAFGIQGLKDLRKKKELMRGDFNEEGRPGRIEPLLYEKRPGEKGEITKGGAQRSSGLGYRRAFR